jgi:predicted DNA-binding protein (MmcQ/YjbR family)
VDRVNDQLEIREADWLDYAFLNGEKHTMAKTDAVLMRMREICLSLPDTKETITWGKPHFRVGEKIFAGCGEENGRQVIGFKLQMAHAEAVIKDPRFWRAPYVGHKGWVSMDASGVKDWDEVRAMILESFRLIAPRKTLAKLEGGVVPGGKEATKEARAARTGSTAKTRQR